MATTAPRADAGLRRLPAWPLTALGAALWLIAGPPTPDLAAHEYRAAVARRIGMGVWEQGWYGGHHLPGYSVLMPPLAALLSPQLVAAVAVVVAAWCFERLARDHWAPDAARAASLWCAIGVLSTLLGGQLTFAAGLAPALGALLAAREGRVVLAAALAAATTLTSPVTAAFLVLAAGAWWLAGRGRPALWVAAGAVVPGLLIVLAFPEGGTQPFSVSSFAWALAVSLVLLVVFPRDERALRIGAGLYAAVLVAGIVVDTPLGGNLVRLAAVFGGPLAAGALWERRRTALIVLALPLLYWQWLAPVRSVVRGAGDPSSSAAYHAPLLAELDRRRAAEGPFRVEIPFTADHWETRYVGLDQPLARGWERQLDVKLNGLFYKRAELTPARYRRWLDDLAVRYVAVADVRPDPAGAAERRLVTSGVVPGLREVWRNRHWRLYRLAGARPLATPPLRVTAIGLDTVTLTAPVPVPARGVVRVRWTPYWKLVSGRGCVGRAPGGWTAVTLDAGGTARLAVRFAIGRIRATGPRCSR
jgi:hypothetical protein